MSRIDDLLKALSGSDDVAAGSDDGARALTDMVRLDDRVHPITAAAVLEGMTRVTAAVLLFTAPGGTRADLERIALVIGREVRPGPGEPLTNRTMRRRFAAALREVADRVEPRE